MCDHFLGPLPCDNADEHRGGPDGRGCTHTASWAADSHTEEPNDE